MDKVEILFFLFVIGILVQAAILQVSSYTPLDGNIFFHSFSIAYILWSLKELVDFKKPLVVIASLFLIFIWWSGVYWKYTERIVQRTFGFEFSSNDQDVISINTYKLEADTAALDKSTWKVSKYKSFKSIYMPTETIDGIDRLMELPIVKSKGSDVKLLNMTELTPLAEEMKFALEKGTPLWYHLGVGMFQNELDFFIKRIESEYYDVVLFEIIPNLNSFYPNEVRNALQENYQLIDRFQAPRRRTDEIIEVYIRKK